MATSVMDDVAADAQEQPTAPKMWAAEDADKLISTLDDKERAYFDFCQRRGYMAMWEVMCMEYWGQTGTVGFDAESVGVDGQEGELTRFRVAELRSHIRQSLAMNTRDRPSFKAVPTNMDYESRAQLDAAETGMTYVYKTTFGERKEREAAEFSDLFATSYSWVQWDPDGGEDVLAPAMMKLPDGQSAPATDESGQPIVHKQKTGAITTDVLCPWEQFCDPTLRDQTKHTWRATRQRRSKWEVAAAFPQHAAYIISQSPRDEVAYQLMFGMDTHTLSTDDVIVKHFYHARTPAMPEGRHVVYLGKRVLEDGPLPYENVPVYELQGSTLVGSALGYSDSWDLAVLQQMLTQVTSDMATAVNTYGHPGLFMDKGTDIDMDALANGTFVLTKPMAASKPEYMQPPAMNQGAFQFMDVLLKFFREISGLNAVVRGDTSSEIKSGQHAALYHAVAQEFQNERIAALNLHRERLANAFLDILKRYANHAFMVEVVGADERTHLESFTREQVTSIKRVMLEATKPSNLAAQMDIAKFLQEIGAGFETPEQAIEFVLTGKLKPLLRSTHSKLLRVQWENDEITKGRVTVSQVPATDPMTGGPMLDEMGQPVMDEITPEIPVYATDDPFVHIPEVLSLLDSPEAVRNPRISEVVFAHVKWHVRVYQQMDPVLASILKIPPPMTGVAALHQMMQQSGGQSSSKSSPNSESQTPQREQVGPESMKLPTAAQPPAGANVNV